MPSLRKAKPLGNQGIRSHTDEDASHAGQVAGNTFDGDPALRCDSRHRSEGKIMDIPITHLKRHRSPKHLGWRRVGHGCWPHHPKQHVIPRNNTLNFEFSSRLINGAVDARLRRVRRKQSHLRGETAGRKLTGHSVEDCPADRSCEHANGCDVETRNVGSRANLHHSRLLRICRRWIVDRHVSFIGTGPGSDGRLKTSRTMLRFAFMLA